MTNSPDSLPTLNTQETISKSRFTDDEVAKSSAFFARIVTIYGRSRAKTLWGDSNEQLQLMRREWAKTIGALTLDELETIFERLKQRLAEGDEDYKWPDVPRMLALLKREKREPAHELFLPALPEPPELREKRRKRGRVATRTIKKVLSGKACFLEDKPNGN